MKSKEYAWAYLLSYGCVANKWSYYGRYECDTKATKQCLLLLNTTDIDWGKTKGPSDGNESCFNGTFNEEPCYIKTLSGKLYLQNGTSFSWGCTFDEPMNVFDMLEFMNNRPSIKEIATERLKLYA